MSGVPPPLPSASRSPVGQPPPPPLAKPKPPPEPVKVAPPPPDSFQQKSLSITDSAQRKTLIEGSGQVNAVSKKAGNENSICAGAAVTNAMLQDCKTPADCKRNAKALASVADKMEAWKTLPAGVDKDKVKTALKNLENGKLTPEDAQHLHQLNYAIARSAQGTKSPPGISVGAMTATVGMLRAEGAMTATEPKFHMANLPNGSGHWTTTTGGVHSNSFPGKVSAGTPNDMKASKDPKWQAEISVTNGKYPDISSKFRPAPGEPQLKSDEYYVVNYDPAKLKPKNGPDCVRVLKEIAKPMMSEDKPIDVFPG